MFHVERLIKTAGFKVTATILATLFLLISCGVPKATIQIDDYTLLRGGKEVLGRKDGLVAFVFENNQRKMPFNQFIVDKYKLGSYQDVSYWVTIDGTKYKVLVYENAELEKYFDTSAFMVSNVEPELTIVGSKARFLALSVIDEYNEDCLADGSLHQNIALEYLKKLKQEYYSD